MFYIPIKASVEAELNSLIEAVTQAKDVFQKALSKTGCEQVSKADKLARKVGNYRSGLRYLKHTGGLSAVCSYEFSSVWGAENPDWGAPRYILSPSAFEVCCVSWTAPPHPRPDTKLPE